ncbi:hypothetical protein ANCDUO_20992, partial [Ancylostoma duodenale]
NVDVIYVTRIQKERFANEEDYNKMKGSYVLTAKLLNNAARPQEFGGNILVGNSHTTVFYRRRDSMYR